MMKKFIAFMIFMASGTYHLQAQSSDYILSHLSDSISKKITLRSKVGVWDFTDNNDQPTNIGKYLSEQISAYLANYPQLFSMIDRNHLHTIMREHQLNDEGLIDVNTAKELGKIKAVDAIITGTATVLDDKVKLIVKILDTETAFIIGAVKVDLPRDEDINSLLGTASKSMGGNLSSNKGFNNVPLNSNEQYNNQETVSSNCETTNTGDYCVKNNTSHRLRVNISQNNYENTCNNNGSISISPGETQCFYNKCAGAYKYIASIDESNTWKPTFRQGEIAIEKCKSKTFFLEESSSPNSSQPANNSQQNSNTTYKPPATSTPNNSFTGIDEYDFGTVRQGQKITHTFYFQNKDHSVIAPNGITTSCSCITAKRCKGYIWKGQSCEIRVEFDTNGKSGIQDKSVTFLYEYNEGGIVTKNVPKVFHLKGNITE